MADSNDNDTKDETASGEIVHDDGEFMLTLDGGEEDNNE